jgi:hypothetical protein
MAVGSRARRFAARPLGAAIAAVCGVVLLISTFVPWSRGGGPCVAGVCDPTAWSLLYGYRAWLLVAAIAGAGLPLLGLPFGDLAVRLAAGAAAGLALGAALLALFRLGINARELAPVEPALSAGGPPLALAASLGIAGGAILAAIGSRLLEPVAAARRAATPAALGGAGVVVSLSLPWIKGFNLFPGEARANLPVPTYTAWEAFSTADALLLAGAVAVVAAAVLATVGRWRATFVALAAVGWLVAGCAVVAAPNAARLNRPPSFEVLVSYEPGYYICLGCAGVIVTAGLAGALVAPAPGTGSGIIRA